MRNVSERRTLQKGTSPRDPERPRGPGTLSVELARHLLSHIAPGEFRIVHVWTPELDLIILRPSRALRRRMKKRDFEAISSVVETLCERAGRPAVVEVQ